MGTRPAGLPHPWGATSCTLKAPLTDLLRRLWARGIGILGEWQLSTGAFRSTDAVHRMRQITSAILARDGLRGMYLGLGPSVLQVRAWPLSCRQFDRIDSIDPHTPGESCGG